MSTLAEVLRSTERILGEDGAIEAQIFLSYVLAKPRSWLYAHSEDTFEDAMQLRLSELIKRRQRGEPVAYIVGRRGFWSFDLKVTPTTLIPRPETEGVVSLALDRIPPEQRVRVLDMGTGSGAIALAIAAERPCAQVTAVDASYDALEVAHDNAKAYGLERVRLLHSDWFSALTGQYFDLIVSNPPYIAENDPHLTRGDLRFEPVTALVSGKDGLDDLRNIITMAPDYLESGGWLLVEHGYDQAQAVRALFADASFSAIETILDNEARDRVTCGRKP